MYVRVPSARHGLAGFWGTLVKGSLFVGKTGISVAAAGATGGASAVAVEAASQAAQIAANKSKGKVQATAASSQGSSGNFLDRLSSTELALAAVSGLVLVISLARRR